MFTFIHISTGVEYFQFIDPSLPATIRQCAASGEDPTCSDLILSMGIDAAHLLVRYGYLPLLSEKGAHAWVFV